MYDRLLWCVGYVCQHLKTKESLSVVSTAIAGKVKPVSAKLANGAPSGAVASVLWQQQCVCTILSVLVDGSHMEGKAYMNCVNKVLFLHESPDQIQSTLSESPARRKSLW